jgi:uncharacterized tellurite resistance protein B-like protein
VNPTELNEAERAVLIDLLAYMLRADGDVEAAEIAELQALEEELAVDGLASAVQTAPFGDRDAILDDAVALVRPTSRELFRTILHDLAFADGHGHAFERELLDALTLRWARAGA